MTDGNLVGATVIGALVGSLETGCNMVGFRVVGALVATSVTGCVEVGVVVVGALVGYFVRGDNVVGVWVAGALVGASVTGVCDVGLTMMLSVGDKVGFSDKVTLNPDSLIPAAVKKHTLSRYFGFDAASEISILRFCPMQQASPSLD